MGLCTCISFLHLFQSLSKVFRSASFSNYTIHYEGDLGLLCEQSFNKMIVVSAGVTATYVLWTDIILRISLGITSGNFSTLNMRRIESIKISFKWWSPIPIIWWWMCWRLLFINFIKRNDSRSWSSVISKINNQRSLFVIIFLITSITKERHIFNRIF